MSDEMVMTTMGKFEIWLRDTLAQAEKFLAEAEGERDASPEKYSEWNYWRGRANAFNEAVNTFRLMDNDTSEVK